MAGSTYVEGHTPPVADPAAVAEAQTSHAAGMRASEQRQGHHMANAAAGCAGDVKPAASVQQPPEPPPLLRERRP